jgi:hypothetical protein
VNSQDTAEPYEILAGLPPYGPAPYQFSDTGHGFHREGFVVRFRRHDGSHWTGNFHGDVTSCRGVFRHPNRRHFVVVASGVGYVVEPDDPDAYHCLEAWIHEIIEVPDRGILLFVDGGVYITTLDALGQETRSQRVSWDGIRHLCVSDSQVSAEAYDPMVDRWAPFTLDLDTREIQGSSY